MFLSARPIVTFVFTAVLFSAAASPLHAQATEKSITKELEGLRALPDAEHGPAIGKIALDIRTLPAGPQRLQLAVSLVHLATEGDPGLANIQAAAVTLADTLKQTPAPAKDGKPAEPYMELAKLAHYIGIKTDLSDPQLDQAQAILTANDADIQKADFTLTDLHDKKWTLSQLKGKIVMVNFWATWCQPCRKEMPDLDAIYKHYKSEDLVILSLSNESPLKVSSYVNRIGYTYPILLDSEGKAGQQFHVDGIPQSFVFNRDGKLVGHSIDMLTQMQIFRMLAHAGLKPQ